MLHLNDPTRPIYNSLRDLEADKSINHWFNLTIYDDTKLSHMAQEIENILQKVPDSYLYSSPFDFNHFQSLYPQPSFSDLGDIEYFRMPFKSPKQI